MKILLESLLPRLFPDLEFLCIPHEGKRDLELSIPRKLRAWREPGVQFIIVRDNDRNDCFDLKAKLTQLCWEGGRPDALVRIVCQELEAWYFGDPDAMAEAFDNKALRTISSRKRYREPDLISHPSKEIKRLVPQFQKVSGARRIAAHLSRERNRSISFQTLISGVERLIATMHP